MNTVKRRCFLLPVLLFLFLLLSLVPILLLGRYARASADDYCYGLRTMQALQNGHGFWAAVWHTMWGYYQSWQGSFVALGLMSLTPCIFSEQSYWLTPVVMLVSLILGTMKLADTLVRRVLGGTWREAVCISLPILLLSIQFVPSPLHSFFWWNGAVYYTFLYGISLLYLERFIALLTGGRWWMTLLPGILCGIAVGGGNYVSALLCTLLGGLLLLLALYRKKRRWQAVLLFGAEALAFGFNMAAPGNQIRQATGTVMPPVRAILSSIAKAAVDLPSWHNWLTLLLCLAWVPLLLKLAKRSGISFRRPETVCLMGFLLFAAQNTPHFYALSSSGPPRLRNIVYFSSYWLILFQEWYLLGWLRQIPLPQFLSKKRLWQQFRRVMLPVLLLLAAVGCIYYWPALCSVRCVEALTDGSAAAYAVERDSRLPILTDPTITDPAFRPIHARPELLFEIDIVPDPTYWVNHVVATYWGKHSVALDITVS